MKNNLTLSVTILLVMGVISSIPLVLLSISAQGFGFALLTGLLAILLVFLGPLSIFIGASSLSASTVLAGIIATVILGLSWHKVTKTETKTWYSSLPTISWGLCGIYFGVFYVLTNAT
ncbi:hypothetical protein [Aurantivibrio plasticivorans]